MTEILEGFDPFAAETETAPACFRRAPWVRKNGRRKSRPDGGNPASRHLQRWGRHHRECDSCSNYDWYYPVGASIHVVLPSKASQVDVRIVSVGGERVPIRVTPVVGAHPAPGGGGGIKRGSGRDPAEHLCEKGWGLFVHWCVYAHFEYMKEAPSPSD